VNVCEGSKPADDRITLPQNGFCPPELPAPSAIRPAQAKLELKRVLVLRSARPALLKPLEVIGMNGAPTPRADAPSQTQPRVLEPAPIDVRDAPVRIRGEGSEWPMLDPRLLQDRLEYSA
jgi:hypothetical protein